MDLKDKSILISGASGGMGEELARQLAKKGNKIAIFARREEKLKKIADEISNKNTTCIYKQCDVSNKKDVQDAVNFTHKKFGKIDVAFLNAGILVPTPIETFDGDIIINSMKINFFGDVYFLDSLLPIMKKQDKSIIALTSTLPDSRGIPGWGAYGASKAAISWLTESLRAEALQKYNIKFITIKPGSVETPMIEGYHRHGSITTVKAVARILRGVEKEKKIIQFPLYQVIPCRFTDLFPAWAYDLQNIELMKGPDYPNPKD